MQPCTDAPGFPHLSWWWILKCTQGPQETIPSAQPHKALLEEVDGSQSGWIAPMGLQGTVMGILRGR